MSDNYAVINGKRIELTDEQIKTLGIERKNPFERATAHNEYYYITAENQVDTYIDIRDAVDDRLYSVCNYFNEKKFANQVALHQLLYRKLLKFSYDNDCEDKEWNGTNDHWLILYYPLNDDFVIANVQCVKEYTVYFSTEEGASRAINEVVRPFMKEHPNFVW